MSTKTKDRKPTRIVPHRWEDGRWYAHIYGRKLLFLHTVKFFGSRFEAIKAAEAWLKQRKERTVPS